MVQNTCLSQACVWKPSYNKDKLCIFFVIKYVSQRLGYAAPISLTKNGSVLPIPGYGNHIFTTEGLLLWQPCYYVLVS